MPLRSFRAVAPRIATDRQVARLFPEEREQSRQSVEPSRAIEYEPTAKPPQQRPELPDFWEHRFRNGVTPWDAGRAPQALQRFAAGYVVAVGAEPPINYAELEWRPLRPRPLGLMIVVAGMLWHAECR